MRPPSLLKNPSRAFRLAVAAAGILMLIASTWIWPPELRSAGTGVVLTVFAALLAYFPFQLMGGEFSLISIITLGSGLVYGPAAAGWAVTLGAAIGYLARRRASGLRAGPGRLPVWETIAFAIGHQNLSLILTMFALGMPAGFIKLELSGQAQWLSLLWPILAFSLIHALLYVGDARLRKAHLVEDWPRERSFLILLEILPIPFIVVAVVIFPISRIGSLGSLLGIPAILAIILYIISNTRTDLERRLEELSVLNHISSTLSATLELETLLSELKDEITRFLRIDNFYVALLDPEKNELWYPIAVKYGERRQWPRRPRAQRLTDRVIQEGQPVMIPRNAYQELGRIGMPTGEDAMFSWMGVPLITSDRTLGCLGAFSINPPIEFTPQDLKLMTTLAGQVSVAIENALLYEQTQRRTVQLETLTQLTTLITASLNLSEVLSQICRAVAQVVATRRSAIYLIDEAGQVSLAHAEGLSEEYLSQTHEIAAASQQAGHCLSTGQPGLVSEIAAADLPEGVRSALQAEGIQAYGDFPLTTPAGQIGFLSVYFDQPHRFDKSQIELLMTFASQAALAVANARLYASTDQALADRINQLTIIGAVGRKLLAAFDADRLFDMILNYAREFTESPWGHLSVYHAGDKTIEVKASRGYQLPQTRWPVRKSITARAIRTRQMINVPDVTQDEDFIDLTDGRSRAQLSVPLIYENRVLGVITLESPVLNAFGENAQSLVNQLANQAAVALHNAELYGEIQRRLREQSTLYVVTSHLTSNLELESVLRVVSQAMRTALQPARVGVYLWEEEHQRYSMKASLTPGESQVELPQALPSAILDELEPISLRIDILQIPAGRKDLAELFAEQAAYQALLIPLTVKEERLGLILIHMPRERRLQTTDLQLLQAVAAQGAIALQNALLFADVIQGRDRLSAILNSVGEGIVMVDTHGRVLLANAQVETYTGMLVSDLLHHRLPALPISVLNILGFTPEQAAEISGKLAGGLVLDIPRATIKLNDPAPGRILERSVLPVSSQNERTIGMIIILRDLTEEHKIQQARQMITDTLIHDLRSPISAVMSALDVLGDAPGLSGTEDELVAQAMKVAQRSTERVYNLVNSLLEIARLQSGDLELNRGPLKLGELTAQVVKDFSMQADEFGVRLENHIPLDLPPVNADRSKIERVLFNLVDNALKFAPAGGEIRLNALLEAGERVIIQISDNGPGIPEDYREKIFDRFSQVPGRRGRTRGTGLGLAFCKLALDAHGERIWVEPASPEGSTFAFSLPVHHSPATLAAPAEPPLGG